MRLSHTRKALLISLSLVLTGLLGQAAAAESSHTETATPAVIATSSRPAVPPVARKPAPETTRIPPRTEKKTAPKRKPKGRTGPGGAVLTTGTKSVALTFDDGPDPANTPALLRMLAKHHVKATFCLVGSNAKDHPELVRKIVAGGHTLCNHTWNHDLRLGRRSAAKIRADMRRTNAAILAAAPKAKIGYFRAPGGNFTPQIVKIAKDLGMKSIYWKVDPRDWEHGREESDGAHTARVVAAVKHRTHAGAIVLSHDYAQPDTIRAYRKLLPWLRKRFHLIALP